MKIILLNGPAGSGKDTAAALLAEANGGGIVKFASPLKRAAAAIYFSGNQKKFDEFDTYEEKGIEREEFFGKSCRQVQIDISEKFLKVQHGQDVFGRILSKSLSYYKELGYDTNFYVSDSGFVPEAEVLVKDYSPANVILVRIYRPGYNFEGDSRSYIRLDHLGVQSHDVHNDGTPTEFLTKLMEIIEPFTNEKA